MNDVFKYERRKEKIGVRIRQERRKLPGRVSQEALGERLAQVIPTRDNIKQTTVASWESGRTLPPLDALIAMSEVFGCDIGYLLGDYERRFRDVQDICERTGLSERTVDSLIRMYQDNPQYPWPRSMGGTRQVYSSAVRFIVDYTVEKSTQINRLAYNYAIAEVKAEKSKEKSRDTIISQLADSSAGLTLPAEDAATFYRSQIENIFSKRKIAQMLSHYVDDCRDTFLKDESFLRYHYSEEQAQKRKQERLLYLRSEEHYKDLENLLSQYPAADLLKEIGNATSFIPEPERTLFYNRLVERFQPKEAEHDAAKE